MAFSPMTTGGGGGIHYSSYEERTTATVSSEQTLTFTNDVTFLVIVPDTYGESNRPCVIWQEGTFIKPFLNGSTVTISGNVVKIKLVAYGTQFHVLSLI